MLESLEKHDGFAHNRARWDWASTADYIYLISGASTRDLSDRSGWVDACRVADSCPGYRDETILEWGSGSGRVTQFLCRMFRHTHAVDIAGGMLSLIADQRLPDLTLHHTDGAGLAPGIVVDVVYSYLCWMHNRKEDLPGILRTCRSILKPTGKLLFQLPVYDEPREPQSFSDIACWTPREFLDLADETGFAVARLTASIGAFAMDAVGANHFELHEWHPRPDAPPRPNGDGNGSGASP